MVVEEGGGRFSGVGGSQGGEGLGEHCGGGVGGLEEVESDERGAMEIGDGGRKGFERDKGGHVRRRYGWGEVMTLYLDGLDIDGRPDMAEEGGRMEEGGGEDEGSHDDGVVIVNV